MKNVFSVFKREFKSYFDSPVAYVFLTAFLVLMGFMTFVFAGFYEARQATLAPFFFWHPWVYLLLVPAATMGLWADERHNGTAELLLTFPVSPAQILAGKFFAAWAFLALSLALTSTVAFTAGYLGSPDWGAVACGYLGSLLLSGAAAAIGLFASSLSRSPVVGFVVSFAMLFFLLIVGFGPVSGALAGWGCPAAVVDGVAALSLLTHYEALGRGVVDVADVLYYAGATVFFLAAAKTVVESRRGSARGAASLACAATIAVAACAIASKASIRFDFTEEKLYTLTGGSKAVLGKLDKDVALKFYFSASSKETPNSVKEYAREVENLLKEYVRASNGRLALEKYDPAPDSDEEEWAQKYGIAAQPGENPFGQPVYFGVAAVCGDRIETLGAISQRMAPTLEYDLTRLVTRVAWPERPVVGVMSSIDDVLGSAPNPMMGMRQSPGWAAFSELAKDYDVRKIDTSAESIDEDVKTLVVLHAKDLSDNTLCAIDAFVMRGGRLVAFTDPFSLREMISLRSQAMMGMAAPGSSTLGKLFDAWGVKFDDSRVVCDLAAATDVNNGVTEPAVLTLGADNVDADDLLVSGLSRVMFLFSGAFEFDQSKNPGLEFVPLVKTSRDNSATIDKMSIASGFGSSMEAQPDGHERVLAARLEGRFKTAFPGGPGGTNSTDQASAECDNSVMLFADSDFLADEFCVQLLRTPFGTMARPINQNLTLFSNVIEQFAGRPELIGLRARGISDRPFTVVDDMLAQARRRYQQQEEDFQNELEETQRKLNALQSEKGDSGDLILSPGQQAEIEKLRKSLVETRRNLKNVRKQLTSDIDSLGTKIKWFNIALMPFVVILFGIVRGIRRKSI